MLWDEIDAEFQALTEVLPEHWRAIEDNAGLSEWATDNRALFESVLALIESMRPGIEGRSYYRVGQVVDFDLFPALGPMLTAIDRAAPKRWMRLLGWRLGLVRQNIGSRASGVPQNATR